MSVYTLTLLWYMDSHLLNTTKYGLPFRPIGILYSKHQGLQPFILQSKQYNPQD